MIIKNGMKFERLLVLSREESTRHGKRWKCLCDCGSTTVVYGHKLLSGQAKSCGCIRREKQHGKAGTRLYRIWGGIKTRCNNPNSDHFNSYMGRGIAICDEWRDDFMAFYNWALANGYRDDLTLDRKDPNGNYEPANCRWATTSEQNSNKTTTPLVSYQGETHTLKDWAAITGIKYQTLFWRYKNGWPPEKIIAN